MQGLGYALCEDMGIEAGRVTVSSLAIAKFIVQDIPPIVSSFLTSTVGRGHFLLK